MGIHSKDNLKVWPILGRIVKYRKLGALIIKNVTKTIIPLILILNMYLTISHILMFKQKFLQKII